MGRIKTQLVKRLTKELIAKHGSKFKQEFDINKELVSQYTDISSKKMRDIIAGYVTRLMKAK